MVSNFRDDTLGDKTVRFLIGGALGGIAGWFLAGRIGSANIREFVSVEAGGFLLVGFAAVAFGNRFVEGFIRGGWWH